MDALWKDIRYAVRTLLKRPGFTLVAVLTLGLGIGANTAIFTLLNAVTFKELPVAKPQELVLFSDTSDEGTSMGDPSTERWRRYSFDSYKYFLDHDQSYQALSAFRSGESRISIRSSGAQSAEAAQRAQAHLVSGNYFSVLGASVLLGRALTPADDKPGAQPVAVISYGYWQQRWKSDPSVVNQEVVLNKTSFTIVGVGQPEFFGIRVRRSPDLWVPLVFQPEIEMRESYLANPRAYWLNFVGRLKPGVSLEQAKANANVLLHQFLTNEAGSKLTEERSKSIASAYISVAPGARGISGLRIVYSKALQMLMVIVGLVLLIACANVGNLLLSRAAARRAEMSLRLALGANRFRIIRQLLTESLLLAAIGGALGILFAQWGVKVLVTLVARTSPLDVHPDVLILAFTAGVTLLAGVIFGMAPALSASKTDLTTALKEKNPGKGRRGLRLNLASALVVSQVALSMVLLAGAGLFARSLMKLQEENVGFNRDNVLLVGIDPRLGGYKPTELSTLYGQLMDRLNQIPGVEASTIATYSPISGTGRSSTVTVRGYAQAPGENQDVDDLLIGPDYCKALGVPILLGREFNVRDTPSSQKIAVINKAFAQHYFNGANPIGRRFQFGEDDDPDRGPELEIVGMIGDIKYGSAKENAQPTAYRPILQVDDSDAYSSNVEIRTSGDPSSLAATVRQAIEQVDPKLPVFGVTTLREQLSGALQQEKLIAQLVSFFGVLALLLASIGLYGLMAHGVVRRTKEIGIRMALGAERRSIIWMVLKETVVLVLIGVVIGVPAAIGLSRLIASQLFGTSPSDPITLVGGALLLVGVALLAGFLPARKASKVDPLIALRYE
ncbi:MAG TPA: ABC transporter permease [Pyrinomonadaceae bacterium]|nr:ABC transporter permease [Pyrinomonadaceae bacterium]